MISVSRAALGLALALGGGLIAAASPGLAQEQRAITLNEQERTALQALKTALETKNYAAATSALTTAQQVARSGYSRYLASRSEEHTSELQSLMRISYAVFCLKKQNNI